MFLSITIKILENDNCWEDKILFILAINLEVDPCELWAADYNLDEVVNVTDLISMVNVILLP